jgi:hypothetical protein
MKMTKVLLGMGFAGVLMATTAMAPRAEAATRIVVRPSYGFYYGPAFYGPGWRRPWGDRVVVVEPPTGDVKINTAVKNEPIYVDGGFVGQTGKLKKMPLAPGNHVIEIRDVSGHDVYQNTINVIAGRTVDITC